MGAPRLWEGIELAGPASVAGRCHNVLDGTEVERCGPAKTDQY
jgi:hypothetical protein